MPKETVVYQPIPNFPSHYRVGSDGSVWTKLVRGSQKGKLGKWRQLKPSTNRGYKTVNLRRDGKTVMCQVHRIVAQTFLGPCPEGCQCRHLDGTRDNNHVSNLAWGTQTDNESDKLKHGKRPFGSKHGRHILKEGEVILIRRRLRLGHTHKSIAKDFGVKTTTVSSIAIKKSWRHLPEENHSRE